MIMKQLKTNNLVNNMILDQYFQLQNINIKHRKNMTKSYLQKIKQAQTVFNLIIDLYKNQYDHAFIVQDSYWWGVDGHVYKLKITISSYIDNNYSFIIFLNKYNQNSKEKLWENIRQSFQEIDYFFRETRNKNIVFYLD